MQPKQQTMLCGKLVYRNAHEVLVRLLPLIKETRNSSGHWTSEQSTINEAKKFQATFQWLKVFWTLCSLCGSPYLAKRKIHPWHTVMEYAGFWASRRNMLKTKEFLFFLNWNLPELSNVCPSLSTEHNGADLLGPMFDVHLKHGIFITEQMAHLVTSSQNCIIFCKKKTIRGKLNLRKSYHMPVWFTIL